MPTILPNNERYTEGNSQVPLKTVLLSSGDEQHALKRTEVSSSGIISSVEWGRGQSRALGRELAGGDR